LVFFFFFSGGLEFELRALCLQIRRLSHISSPLCSGYFLQMGVSQLFTWARLEP
jgi:hypothetical protein